MTFPLNSVLALGSVVVAAAAGPVSEWTCETLVNKTLHTPSGAVSSSSLFFAEQLGLQFMSTCIITRVESEWRSVG